MYKSKIITENNSGKRIQRASILKEIENSESDIFVEIRGGESLNILSRKYYGSDKYWRIIAHANNLTTNFPKIGTTIRIPQNPKVKFIKE